MALFKRKTDEEKAANQAVRDLKAQERRDRRDAATAQYRARINAINEKSDQDKAAVAAAREENTANFKTSIATNTETYRAKIAAANEQRREVTTQSE